MHENNTPIMTVFAGPNGSGKSTLKDLNGVEYENYINADNIARAEKISNLEAAQKADSLREFYVATGESVAFETVLSTRSKLDLMIKAKELGYVVQVYYMVTMDSEINVGRVAERVNNGGHDVDTAKIHSRFARCMELLPEIWSVADRVRLWDNSFDSPVIIADKYPDGTVAVYDQDSPSKWSEEEIRKLIGIE